METQRSGAVIRWMALGLLAWALGALLAVTTARADPKGTPAPHPLTFTPGGKILFLGDSWTQNEVLDPNKSESAVDSSLWDGRTSRFIFPDENGNRFGVNDIANWQPASGNWAGASYTPSASDFAQVKYYSHAATWANRLATLLGTNYYYPLAMGGARLVNYSSGGTKYPTGLENYAVHNQHFRTADLIVIHIGINDINGTTTLDTLKANYIETMDALWAANPDVKILVVGMTPIGDDEYGEGAGGATAMARADSLDAWISGRAPYYEDSTGLKQSLCGVYADETANGRLSGFSPTHWIRFWHPTNDAAISACADTIWARFNSDDLHLNWRGDQYLAQLIGWKVFDLTVPGGSDTLDVGDWPTPQAGRTAKTIYVNAATGDNFLNWMNPTSESAPMATVQGAIFRAQPGDRIECAADEYADYWRKSTDGYFQPWGYFADTSQRVTIDGNGSTYTKQTSVDRWYIAPAGLTSATSCGARPDSVKIANYTFVGWTWDDWLTASVPVIYARNTSGLVFEDCTFNNQSKVFTFDHADNTDTANSPLPTLTVEFNDCAINGWDNNTGTGYCINVDSDAAGFDTSVIIDGCTVVDTVGTKSEAFFYTDQPSQTTLSAGTLIIRNSTFYVDGMAVALFYPANDTDVHFINNAVYFGSTSTVSSNPDFIRATATSGDTLWCINNIVEFKYAAPSSERSSWPTTAEWYSGNYSNTATTPLCATSGNVERNFKITELATLSTACDTIKYGGTYANTAKSGWPSVALSGLGVTHASTHASIGPTQYTDELYVWPGNVSGRGTSRLSGPWHLLQLINAGVLSASDSLTTSTWYHLPRVYNESDATLIRSWFDAYENWPDATRKKMRFAFDSHTMSIAGAAATYNGPWALYAAIPGSETASDSLTASTWFTLPRPYNQTDALQLDFWLRCYRKWPDAMRKKIRFKIAGADLSFDGAVGHYGPWSAWEAIGTTEAASDSLTPSTWFLMPRVPPDTYAQLVQNRIYLDAIALWPDSKRKQVRAKTR